jgi:hypothetical protein
MIFHVAVFQWIMQNKLNLTLWYDRGPVLCVYFCSKKSCCILHAFQATHHEALNDLLRPRQPGYTIPGRGKFLFSPEFETGCGTTRALFVLQWLLLVYENGCLPPRLQMHGVLPPDSPHIVISLYFINSFKPFSKDTLQSQRTLFRVKVISHSS